MRLVAGVLSLALFAPFAHAEDPATPPAPTPVPAPPAPGPSEGARARVPFFVVRVMPETRQALLFDRSRNTHVLAEVGGKLDGYTIEDIDDETVSLRRDNQQIVLTAPLHGAGRTRELSPVRVRSALAPMSAAAAPTVAGAPGPASGGPAAPIDPYGDPPSPASGVAAPARLAPPVPGDGLPPEPGIRVAHAPDGSALPASAPVLVPGEGGVRVAVAPDVGPGADPGSRPSAPPSVAGPAASLAGPAASLAPPGAPPVGAGAIRVVSAAPSVAGPAASLAPPGAPPEGSGAIRVVSAAPSAAPPAQSAGPGAPSAAPGAPSAAPLALPAPGAIAGIPSAALVVSPAPRALAGAPSAAPADPYAAPDVPDPPSREIVEPVATPSHSPVAATAPTLAAVDPSPVAIREVRAADATRAPDKQTADARALADILTADHPTRSPRAAVELPPPTHGAEVRPAVASAPGDAIAIPRGDLDSALADFARLTAGVHGSFSATGVVISSVGDGTIFQRAGLRTGDVVTSVDGVRLRTLDDAANLYARASTARAITAQVVRAGKPVTLHVVIQ